MMICAVVLEYDFISLFVCLLGDLIHKKPCDGAFL